jgi:hypothetical protein
VYVATPGGLASESTAAAWLCFVFLKSFFS